MGSGRLGAIVREPPCAVVAARLHGCVEAYDHCVRFRVLGELEVIADDVVHSIGSANQRRVLASLLAHPNRAVSADALIESLWMGDPPATALATLRTYVSRLRRLVGDAIAAEPMAYRIVVDPSELDATVFERRLDEAAAVGPAQAVGLLDAALAMWSGRAFGDQADVPLILAAARRLEERRVDACEARAAALLASGEPTRAAADARSLLDEVPLREGVWVTVIDSLIAADRSAEATRCASQARAVLAEAGLEPGPSLRGAEARALGIVDQATTTAPPPVSAPPSTEGGIGRAIVIHQSRPSSFIGRERQLDDLSDLVELAPLVTLVGPGGVGKTRLAVELAARVASRHRLGARLIELGGITEPDDVVAAIASGLGLTVDRRSIDQALANAGELDMILVIDNAEHVAAAVARAVEWLMAKRGSLRVVVTSRERLAVDGEHVRAVRPLATDGTTSPAQVLLRDRAAAVGARHDGLDPVVLTQVVQRLDGLPLAIEMAAAQLTSCSLTELLATLDRHADSLSAPATSVPPRHRSLSALIDWSVDRLDPDDVALLHRLTVFAGGFTASDLAGILGDGAVDGARRLADRSLITAEVADQTTFQVLFVVRERIRHRCGPLPADVQAAHARWYLARTRSAITALLSPRESDGRDAVNEVVDELRAAHRWATDHDRPTALALSAALHPFAQSSLNDELLSWADRLVAAPPAPGDDPDDVAIAIASAATRTAHRGDHRAAAALARRAVAIATTAAARLPALEALADALLAEGELDDSDAAYQRLIDEGEVAGRAWYAASGAAGVLLVAAYANRPPSRPVDPALLGPDVPPSARAWLAFGEAEIAALDDPRRAEALLHRALSLAVMARNRFIEGVCLVSLASAQHATGAWTAALTTFRAVIQHWLDAADHTHQVTTLRNVAPLLRDLELPAEAAQLLAGLSAAHVTSYGSEEAKVERVDRWLDDVLAPAEHADARALGAQLSVTELARWTLSVIDRTRAQLESPT